MIVCVQVVIHSSTLHAHRGGADHLQMSRLKIVKLKMTLIFLMFQIHTYFLWDTLDKRQFTVSRNNQQQQKKKERARENL